MRDPHRPRAQASFTSLNLPNPNLSSRGNHQHGSRSRFHSPNLSDLHPHYDIRRGHIITPDRTRMDLSITIGESGSGQPSSCRARPSYLRQRRIWVGHSRLRTLWETQAGASVDTTAKAQHRATWIAKGAIDVRAPGPARLHALAQVVTRVPTSGMAIRIHGHYQIRDRQQ